MGKKRVRKVKNLKIKRFLILAIGIVIIYLIINPVNILKNNFFKPASIAANSSDVATDRYKITTSTSKPTYKNYSVTNNSSARKWSSIII